MSITEHQSVWYSYGHFSVKVVLHNGGEWQKEQDKQKQLKNR